MSATAPVRLEWRPLSPLLDRLPTGGDVQWQRGDDCMRCALATMFGCAYDEAPDTLDSDGAEAQFAAVAEWAETRGYQCRRLSSIAAPMRRRAVAGRYWIAAVRGLGEVRMANHAVLALGHTLIFDPSLRQQHQASGGAVFAPNDGFETAADGLIFDRRERTTP